MKHIFTTIGQYLAALLIAIGLGAYGCADTASVNPVAELASLTVTSGTLTPTFNGATTQYSVDLTSNITSVTVMAQPAVAGDTVTINGQTTTSHTIPLNPAGSSTQVSIVVSESGSNSRTYTVLINRAGPGGNNSLLSLSVSPGTLAPAFNANTLRYTVNVANSDGSVTVTPTLQDLAATMTVEGRDTTSGQAQTFTLPGPGSSTLIDIVVTAQNGTQKTYIVSVNRGISGNNFLDGLIISPGTLAPPFSAGEDTYTVNVASNVDNVTVTPTLDDTTASMSIRVNLGSLTTITSGVAQPIPLSGPNSTTLITIRVTAENGNQNNYFISVTRAASGDNNLSALRVALSVSAPNLINNFDPNTTSYTVNVATNVTSVTVSATKSDPNAVMSGSLTAGAGVATGQATIPLGGPGTSTPVSITVTAPNGSAKTYAITVNRLSDDNNLSALTVTPGTLSPAFASNTLNYNVEVAIDVTEVTVTATKSDPNAVLSGSVLDPGAGQATGQATIPLGGPGTATPVTITVTAPNGSAKTYTITVNRLSNDNNLSALSVTPGSLDPAFAANTLTYTVNVATDVTEVTVTATKSDPNAVLSGSVLDPGAGQATGQATIPLGGPGTATPVTITVTAPNGSAKTYTITVNRAAPSSDNNLSVLTATPGSLDPAFTTNTLSYTVNVATEVTSVTVAATKSDLNAVMQIHSVTVPAGTASGQDTIPLNGPGTDTPVSIIVTAQNGVDSKTYTITVHRADPGPPPPP